MSEVKRGGDRRTAIQLQVAQERAAQMAALRAQGLTLEQVARQFGVTRQRVHAILSTWPPELVVTSQDGRTTATLGCWEAYCEG